VETRSQHRASLLEKIEALKKEPEGEARDLRIRLLAMERDRVDDWQILDHLWFRNRKLREAMLKDGAAGGWSAAEIDEIEADWRSELEAPMPSCRHCGASPIAEKLTDEEVLARVKKGADEMLAAARAEREAFSTYVRARASSCMNTAPHDAHDGCPGLGFISQP
jgi:hypothetical protein